MTCHPMYVQIDVNVRFAHRPIALSPCQITLKVPTNAMSPTDKLEPRVPSLLLSLNFVEEQLDVIVDVRLDVQKHLADVAQPLHGELRRWALERRDVQGPIPHFFFGCGSQRPLVGSAFGGVRYLGNLSRNRLSAERILRVESAKSDG